MAGRIPQTFIDELLDRADIVEVIDSRVTLKKSGRNFMACCPFHEEKTPSFSVQPEKQFYYCFGCGASGNALGFLMEYERMDFRPAIEQLSTKYGLQIPEESQQDAEQGRRKNDLYSVMEKSDSFFREQLRIHPAGRSAVAYLKDRGLSVEIVQQFGMGLVPNGWDNLLSAFETEKHSLELLLEAGMLVRRDAGGGKHRVYDFFRNRITFPIRDSRGRTIAFGGRVMGDDKPKYLNSPETPIYQKSRELYGLYEARQANKFLSRLLVVEGYMDVIALAQLGITNAVATLGTATSQTHLQRMFRNCEEIVFCFDGDKAGTQAARRALDVSLPVMEDGRQLRFLFLPEGEDPDSMVRAEGKEQFEARIETAMPLSEYLFVTASQGLNTETVDGKAAMSQRLLAFLGKLPEGAFQSIMQAELAVRTGLDKAAIEHLARSKVETPEPAPKPRAAATQPPPVSADDTPPVPDYLLEGSAPDDSEAMDGPPVEDYQQWDGLEDLPALVKSRRPLRNSGPPEPMSLVETAIGLLVFKPQLISQVESFEDLRALQDNETDLLLQLLELLHKRPDSSTGMLLGYWYGQPEGEMLTELCGRGIELLREGMETLERQGQLDVEFDVGVEQRFRDTIQRLRSQLLKDEIDAVLSDIGSLQAAGKPLPSELQDKLKSLLQERRDGGDYRTLA